MKIFIWDLYEKFWMDSDIEMKIVRDKLKKEWYNWALVKWDELVIFDNLEQSKPKLLKKTSKN